MQAYVTKARARPQGVQFEAMFILGMLVTHAVLGFAAGLGGQWVESLLGRAWGVLLGPLLILLGMMWPGSVCLPIATLGACARPPVGAWGALLVGDPLSIAVCPLCTPALVVLLGVVVGLGTPWFGLVLLLAFALGRAVPLALGAAADGWLENLRRLAGYRRVFEMAGGLTLVASGLYSMHPGDHSV